MEFKNRRDFLKLAGKVTLGAAAVAAIPAAASAEAEIAAPAFPWTWPGLDVKEVQDKNNWTELLVRQEEQKTLPFGEVWDEYCRVCGKPVDGEWYPIVEKYEAEVQSIRG